MALMLMMLAFAAWLHYLSLSNHNTSLVALKWLISEWRTNPTIQRAAMTALHYMQQDKPLPATKLIQLYTDWYDDNCIDSSHLASSSPKPQLNQLWCELFAHRDQLIDHLWYNHPKTYLILLQNSAEVRPNGWFYGSFVRVQLVSGMVQDMSVHDSYEVPFVNSWVVLSLPEWTTNYLGHTTASFIAGNKFGFTDRDGFIISSIYNKTYGADIDGVVFISTKTLLSLVPSLQMQLWKWQFINASVDLIRGHDGAFKKQIYLDEITDYIDTNKISLMSQAITNYQAIFAPEMVQLYLPDISQDLRMMIKQHHRITDLDPQHLYLRDLNQSYNKIDTFVIKRAWIEDVAHNVLLESSHNIIDLWGLWSGEYVLHITYYLKQSPQYLRYMTQLSDSFDVILTKRERHILWLDPVVKYQSVVFAGTGITMTKLAGDIDQPVIFDAPPAQWAAYQVDTTGQEQRVMINFSIVND
jgi:hypothetical protein